MAEIIDNSVFDAALTEFGTSTRLTLCSGQPANFAGIAAVSMGDVVLTGGDFTNADGDTSGRKVTVASKEVTPTSTGTALVVALDDGATLLATADVTAGGSITTGVAVNVTGIVWEIRDPA